MYLTLSIVFTCLVFLLLKIIEKLKLVVFQTIVFNYVSAFVFGSICFPNGIPLQEIFVADWLYIPVLLSVIFVSVFNVMAYTAQKGGLSLMTVANKMSVVLPILYGVFVFHETLGLFKIVGIVVAILGVFLMVVQEDFITKKIAWIFPFVIFIGSGIADILMNLVQNKYIMSSEIGFFTTIVFFFCAIIGLLVFIIQLLLKKTTFCYKSVIGGLIFGVPNYLSIYFLIKALQATHLSTAIIFTLNNLLIVAFTAVLSMFFFKEKLSKLNFIGLFFALVAIGMFYFGS